MLNFLPKITEKIVTILLPLFVFLVPFFFLSFTSEYYEFNKQALLALFLFLTFGLFFLKTLLSRKLIFSRSPLDLPIFLILLIYLLSTIFSVSPSTSLLGEHGIFHGGLLSFLLYIGLFYLIINTGKAGSLGHWVTESLSYWVTGLLCSVFLLSLLALLQYFEIYLFPWDFTHQRFWTPVGSLSSLLFYLLVVLPLVVSQIKTRPYFGALIPVILAAVFLVSGWGGTLRNFLPEKYRTLPREVSLDWQTSWQIANSVLGVRPLLGSGPATFLSDFTRFKPISFNQTQFWNIRFNRPKNFWFETLATLGILGTGAWIYLWTKILKLVILSWKQGKRQFSVSLLIFLLLTFFYPLSTVTSILFWILLALFVHQADFTEKVLLKVEAVICRRGKKTTKPVPFSLLLSTIYYLLSTIFIYLYFFRLYPAELHYKQATDLYAKDQNKAYQLAFSSAKLNPLVDVYQTGLSVANLSLASQVSKQASPSGQLIRQFSNQAIVSARKAIQLDPKDVRNWENLAGLYQNLLSVDPNAFSEVISALQEAITLDPTNPLLRSQLGRFFFQNRNFSEAVNQYLSAINLKPDYLQVHYDLAQSYKAMGENQKAKTELQTVLSLLPSDSPQRESIQKELDKLGSTEATPSAQPK